MIAYKMCPDCWGVIKPEPGDRDKCICEQGNKMKDLVKDFEDLQMNALGYIKYKVRGKVNEWFIDAFTRNGLLTGTKLARASEHATREWMERRIHELHTTQGIKNVRSH